MNICENKASFIPPSLKRSRYLIICFILLSVGKLYSQERVIRGVITNNTDIEGIHILNRTSRFNTVSNKKGEFRIRVRVLDTIFISSVHYRPGRVVISTSDFESGKLTVELEPLVNELDEVYLGPSLTGNLNYDIKNIEVTDTLNFNDVGIPGFRGEPKEKIIPVYAAVIPLRMDLEAIYKHLSGYYKKLKQQRKWEAQNRTVAQLIQFYTPKFYAEAYRIPEDRLYDFLLFCIETTSIQADFKKENYRAVLETFKTHGAEYKNRLDQKAE